MQFYPGRAADQWRGFAALDAGSSGEPVTRYDSAGYRAAWQHQHRSDNVGYANTEYLGMRGEHDDESGNARHHGTGQRHGCRRNAGRIAAGLLRRKIRTAPSKRTASRTIDRSRVSSVRKRTAFGRPFSLPFPRVSAAFATRRG
jgi:hypothetical protein